MKKLDSISIIFYKAPNRALGLYHYNGSYFKELTFTLYFIEINFHLIYREKYEPDLLWSKEEIEILEKQGKPPLKINKILNE